MGARKIYIEYPVLAKAKESIQKLCSNAVDKLSQNKHEYFVLYQEYIEEMSDHELWSIHKKNQHLLLILTDFISFYYNGDLSRAQRLLNAVRVINQHVAAARILTQLHTLMTQQNQLTSFDAFRLFHEVKICMVSFSEFNAEVEPDIRNLFKQLKQAAPFCVRRLLWPESNIAARGRRSLAAQSNLPPKFPAVKLLAAHRATARRTQMARPALPGESTSAKLLLVNKFVSTGTLCNRKELHSIVCIATRGSMQFIPAWQITVNAETSLLTLTNADNPYEKLDVDGSMRPCLTRNGAKWMVKAIDQQHIKIFCKSAPGIINY